MCPIFSAHQHFLCFAVGPLLLALPFCLLSAPHTFTKVLAPALALLHSHGFLIMRYLDNFLVREQLEQTYFEQWDVGCPDVKVIWMDVEHAEIVAGTPFIWSIWV